MSLRSVGKTKATTTITVCDPETREPLKTIGGEDNMTVTIHGPYSDHYKRVLRDQQKARATEMGSSATASLSAAEIDAFSRNLLIECIESWTVTLEGDEIVPLEREAIEAVFAEFPWLRDDIDVALGTRGNFIERPKPH